MQKIWKINRRLWVDEANIIYRRITRTRVEASDGRVLAAPRAGEDIFLDGRGNGYLFA